MESNWNVNTEEQVIGRAIRFKSHVNLPEKDRVVHIYRLIMKKPLSRSSNDDNPESIDEILYKHSHIKKQPVLNNLINLLKPLALENNKCTSFRINTGLYKRLKEHDDYEGFLKRKIKSNEEKKDKKKEDKEGKEEGKEESKEEKEEKKAKEERNKRMYEQKKKMLQEFNKDYIGRKKSTRRSKDEIEESRKKDEVKKQIEESREEVIKQATEEIEKTRKEREQKSPYKNLVKCYNYFLENNIWSPSKEEYEKNLKKFMEENTPDKISKDKNRQELIKAIKICSDEVKDYDEFVKIINKEMKTRYLPDSVKDKAIKTLDNLFKSKKITLTDKVEDIEKALIQYGNINKDYASSLKKLSIDWKLKKDREERKKADVLEEKKEEKKEEDKDKKKKEIIKPIVEKEIEKQEFDEIIKRDLDTVKLDAEIEEEEKVEREVIKEERAVSPESDLKRRITRNLEKMLESKEIDINESFIIIYDKVMKKIKENVDIVFAYKVIKQWMGSRGTRVEKKKDSRAKAKKVEIEECRLTLTCPWKTVFFLVDSETSISSVGVITSSPESAKSSSSSEVPIVTRACRKLAKITPLASRLRAVAIFVAPRPRTKLIIYSPEALPTSTLTLSAPIPVTDVNASVNDVAVAPIGIPVVEFVP